ncbi:hypothetical protein F5888DRAFT_651601 [Russula emetica]|nr:hypothetical protein F5888DRAFT_651601 [Russula emetica]
MTMFPACIPFPSSDDKENIPVIRSEQRTRCDALIDGTKSSTRPLLERIISRGQSRSPPQITILSDLEREKREAHPLSPPRPKSILLGAVRTLPSVQTIHWSSPSPLHITILSDPEKEKREAHPQSPRSILINPARTRVPSVSQSRSPPHITILSDREREKREAHPLSPPRPKSILLNCSPSHITIISNPEKEKREAYSHSTQRIKSIRNTLAAAALSKRVPNITIRPISILKKAPPPPPPAPAPAADPNPDAVKENMKVKFVLSDIVVQETDQGVRDPETGTGADKTLTSSGEMLSVPLVDWRGRLDEDELARYYPKEHSKEQFVHRLRSMVRSGNRSAAARRRDHARRRRQTATTTTTPPATPPSIALIVSHTGP